MARQPKAAAAAPPPPEQPAAKRERSNRPFPSSSYEEAENFAQSVYEFASGNSVRRLILFNHLGKSPDSSAGRDLITNSSKYGLTKGSYKAESIEVTPEAHLIFGERSTEKEKRRARVKLAIESIPVFSTIYDRFKDLKLPARAALVEAAREAGVPQEFLEQAVDTFTLNLKSVGLLQNISGAERIITIEHMLDLVPNASKVYHSQVLETREKSPSQSTNSLMTSDQAEFESTCFYVTPIGSEDSEFRKHSDLFLSHIVEPALEQFKLKVIRADQIGKPGIISRQIFEYILKSRLVIADLSFHNPNVFYELAVRHMLKKPVVQITRIEDAIPFDVNQMRTVVIDNTDIYSLIPKIELYKSEIGNQVRKALEDEESDNPIAAYYPGLKIEFSS